MTETGHVLFVDLVGYSLLPVEEQARQVTTLLDCVRATPTFRTAAASGELVPIPTGDGVALVFWRFPDAPVRCAHELAAAALPLRMGIHFGPVTRLADINGAETVTGGGINLAKRVMDLAGAGEVYCTDVVAAVLRDYAEWGPQLRALGERATKHGERLGVWALTPQAQVPVLTKRERAGGAVPLHSTYYLERPADRAFADALARRDAIVLLKGARQVGKTSLLARGLAAARQRGERVVIVDFQALSAAQLAQPEALYRALAESVAEQLDCETLPEALWNDSRAGAANLERYLRRVVLANDETLVWAMDEADRLFPCPFGSEVFGLFRSWHNRRALDPEGPWSRLTLALAYATEAHLFITDPNQSPFNVGTRIALSDFTQPEVEELHRRYGSPLAPEALAAFYGLLAGQPYLTRRGFDLLTEGTDWPALAARATTTAGPFAEHLERLLFGVTQESTLTDAVRTVLAGKPCPRESFFRLRSAGVIVGESATSARLRCPLYEHYLRQQL